MHCSGIDLNNYGHARVQDVVTPLDEYVAREDPGLPSWEKIDEYDMSDIGCIAHVVNFTSQIWKDGEATMHAHFQFNSCIAEHLTHSMER
jgi:hypothetical protein